MWRSDSIGKSRSKPEAFWLGRANWIHSTTLLPTLSRRTRAPSRAPAPTSVSATPMSRAPLPRDSERRRFAVDHTPPTHHQRGREHVKKGRHKGKREGGA